VFVRALASCVPAFAMLEKVKYNFVDALKNAHFLIISAQNARISVNFCAFLLIFELFLLCTYVLVR
jgi:hypothetical protein